MMRMLTTLLLLVCFAWSQAAAADCPMAPGPRGQDEGVALDASHHHGHHAPAPAPAGDDAERHPHGPAPHAATGCGLLMSCGATAAPPAHAHLSAHLLDAADGVSAERGRYASPTLSTDPPPPRLPFRS